jgi:hypothetical protein
LLRAWAFATLATGIGVVGHATAISTAPAWKVFVVGLPIAALCAWPLTAVRMRAWLLFVGAALLQIAVHLACSLTTGAASMQSMDHGGMTAEAHMAYLRDGMEVHAASTPVMLAVHLIATLVGVAILLRLERYAWRGLRVVGARLARGLGPALDRRTRRTVPALTIVLPALRVPGSRRWLARAIGRRGPPATACI